MSTEECNICRCFNHLGGASVAAWHPKQAPQPALTEGESVPMQPRMQNRAPGACCSSQAKLRRCQWCQPSSHGQTHLAASPQHHRHMTDPLTPLHAVACVAPQHATFQPTVAAPCCCCYVHHLTASELAKTCPASSAACQQPGCGVAAHAARQCIHSIPLQRASIHTRIRAHTKSQQSTATGAPPTDQLLVGVAPPSATQTMP